ncbi:ATP-binding protein [Picosynechococcus sp. PCC 11901]|uniref:ATP-binding protein n=1 Tax=Picosynechococcus sp. PCC 11901 TaxID=2579791 RepID=UPI0010FBD5E1|nr:ATP-binding protein [Picosynechococcus sp. PCC 11901]QCS48296.1 ATP-binding protein [Picosynechococcus sp. PCC 11901]
MPWISPKYEFDVLMIGNTGVGKTSLLASMADQLQKSDNQHIEIFYPEYRTSFWLGEALTQLKYMCQTDGIIPGLGVEGTIEPRQFVFDIRQKDQEKAAFSIRIHDYPGSAFNPSSEHNESVNSLIERAFLILVFIDMPALMENGGKFNNIRNNPGAFNQILCQQMEAHKKALPILLTGLRGEKYIRFGDYNPAVNKIYDLYENVIKTAQKFDTQYDNVFTCFPQTIGSIIFDEFEERVTDQGKIVPVYKFKKVSQYISYSPKDCDLPLKFLITRALAASVVQRRQYHEGFNWLRDFFGRDIETYKALELVSQEIKNTNLFTFKRF